MNGDIYSRLGIVFALWCVGMICLWVSSEFNKLENEITLLKTVLIVKNIMPTELANGK